MLITCWTWMPLLLHLSTRPEKVDPVFYRNAPVSTDCYVRLCFDGSWVWVWGLLIPCLHSFYVSGIGVRWEPRDADAEMGASIAVRRSREE